MAAPKREHGLKSATPLGKNFSLDLASEDLVANLTAAPSPNLVGNPNGIAGRNFGPVKQKTLELAAPAECTVADHKGSQAS